jgi:hypothetical protein
MYFQELSSSQQTLQPLRPHTLIVTLSMQWGAARCQVVHLDLLDLLLFFFLLTSF